MVRFFGFSFFPRYVHGSYRHFLYLVGVQSEERLHGRRLSFVSFFTEFLEDCCCLFCPRCFYYLLDARSFHWRRPAERFIQVYGKRHTVNFEATTSHSTFNQKIAPSPLINQHACSRRLSPGPGLIDRGTDLPNPTSLEDCFVVCFDYCCFTVTWFVMISNFIEATNFNYS